MQVVWVLIDGLGDVQAMELGLRTPLEAASTPFLDAVSRSGLTGLLDPVEPGRACGSDTAHLALLGYPPSRFYRGRGAFESMGAGLDMSPGDIAFKCNFAFVDEEGVVVNRRADRDFSDAGPILCADLDRVAIPGYPNHEVRVKYATEHRCGVVIHGVGLCDRISGTDPLKNHMQLQKPRPLDDSVEAELTADIVSEVDKLFRRKLGQHWLNEERVREGKIPANAVLLRGCGARIDAPDFEAVHRLRAGMIAPTKIIRGLGMSLGIKCVEVSGATGDYLTRLDAKGIAVKNCLQDGLDLVFCHVKAVDDAGHDRDAPLRVKWLEYVDVMIGQIIAHCHDLHEQTASHITLLITGDHSTPVTFGDHSHEPVPICTAHISDVARDMSVVRAAYECLGPVPTGDESSAHEGGFTKQNERNFATNAFTEATCARGALGRFPGDALLTLIRSMLGTC